MPSSGFSTAVLDVPRVEQLCLREREIGGRRPAAGRPRVDARRARRRAWVLGAHVRAVAEVLAHLPEGERQVAERCRAAPATPPACTARSASSRRQRVVDVAVDRSARGGGAAQRPSAPPDGRSRARCPPGSRAARAPSARRRDRVGRRRRTASADSRSRSSSSSSRADLVDARVANPAASVGPSNGCVVTPHVLADVRRRRPASSTGSRDAAPRHSRSKRHRNGGQPREAALDADHAQLREAIEGALDDEAHELRLERARHVDVLLEVGRRPADRRRRHGPARRRSAARRTSPWRCAASSIGHQMRLPYGATSGPAAAPGRSRGARPARSISAAAMRRLARSGRRSSRAAAARGRATPRPASR